MAVILLSCPAISVNLAVSFDSLTGAGLAADSLATGFLVAGLATDALVGAGQLCYNPKEGHTT